MSDEWDGIAGCLHGKRRSSHLRFPVTRRIQAVEPTRKRLEGAKLVNRLLPRTHGWRRGGALDDAATLLQQWQLRWQLGERDSKRVAGQLSEWDSAHQIEDRAWIGLEGTRSADE